jgi:hypothetical protein
MHTGPATRVQRSTRINAAAAATSRTDDAVCGLGRPGQDDCRLRTASPNHAWSRPNDLAVAYSTRTMTARTPTTAAKPRPAHTRPRDGCPNCTRIAAPSAASHRAVHGVIGGQLGLIRVNCSIPAAQPTHVNAATASTTITAARPHQATAVSRRASGPGLSIDCLLSERCLTAFCAKCRKWRQSTKASFAGRMVVGTDTQGSQRRHPLPICRPLHDCI